MTRMRRVQVQRSGWETESPLKTLADRSIFYAPARWKGGFRWVAKGSNYTNIYLRHGFLYTVPSGKPHPTLKTLQKFPDPPKPEELVPFYEAALCDSE